VLSVVLETPRQDDVRALLRKSEAFSHALYPPQSNHHLDCEELAAPNVRFFVARSDRRAVGCGALVLGDDGLAELKSMFVDEAARGQGIGAAILKRIEDTAIGAGVIRIQLETGIHNAGALALYRRSGYGERAPFANYRADPLSIFMEKKMGSG